MRAVPHGKTPYCRAASRLSMALRAAFCVLLSRSVAHIRAKPYAIRLPGRNDAERERPACGVHQLGLSKIFFCYLSRFVLLFRIDL